MNKRVTTLSTFFALISVLSACGTVKEKTSPCKRPTELLGFYQEPMNCGSMELINQSEAALALHELIGEEVQYGN